MSDVGSRWLLQYAFNVTSQCGEDGIVLKALDALPARTGWCIEFGAWDGRKYSNTYNLVTSHGYRGVFIEADPERFRMLQKTHNPKTNILLNAVVGFDEEDCLDTVLQALQVPFDVDLLSVDIDGNDYHVWAAVKAYQPKLVVIEYNSTIANCVHFVQKKQHGVSHGSSPASLVDLGRSKGYELIAATAINLIFVDAKYYPLFRIPDNSLSFMRDDSHTPHIFVGYDGRIFLSEVDEIGSISLPWHGLKLAASSVQVLPTRLQKYPQNYTQLDRLIYRCRFGFQRPKRLFRRFLGFLSATTAAPGEAGAVRCTKADLT